MELPTKRQIAFSPPPLNFLNRRDPTPKKTLSCFLYPWCASSFSQFFLDLPSPLFEIPLFQPLTSNFPTAGAHLLSLPRNWMDTNPPTLGLAFIFTPTQHNLRTAPPPPLFFLIEKPVFAIKVFMPRLIDYMPSVFSNPLRPSAIIFPTDFHTGPPEIGKCFHFRRLFPRSWELIPFSLPPPKATTVLEQTLFSLFTSLPSNYQPSLFLPVIAFETFLMFFSRIT